MGCKKKKPSCKPKPKPCCSRGGPLTSRGFLNFLREYRACHPGLDAVETVRKGYMRWSRLCEDKKKKYREMKRVPKPKCPKKCPKKKKPKCPPKKPKCPKKCG
ncbi:uncharacterized protein LOC119670054 [Teleopsis dalmanni]|uniref:uncharacterized protein LOC119670054 n=1 Tax=Teleopsis dalmanni TaxID=139649 RepID=UPI0018CD0883|nr:uncharacterized protein LOC119670054 [Teleopsis dalmanni]